MMPYVMSYFVSTVYAALGDRENAFAELDRAVTNRDWRLVTLPVDRLMEPLRGDPRYIQVLKRMNLEQ